MKTLYNDAKNSLKTHKNTFAYSHSEKSKERCREELIGMCYNQYKEEGAATEKDAKVFSLFCVKTWSVMYPIADDLRNILLCGLTAAEKRKKEIEEKNANIVNINNVNKVEEVAAKICSGLNFKLPAILHGKNFPNINLFYLKISQAIMREECLDASNKFKHKYITSNEEMAENFEEIFAQYGALLKKHQEFLSK